MNDYTFLKDCEQYGIQHSQILNTEISPATITYVFKTPKGVWEHTEVLTNPSSRGLSTNAYKLRQGSIFINQLILELENRNEGQLYTLFDTDKQFIEIANKALEHMKQ